jgi:hypothetical protein
VVSGTWVMQTRIFMLNIKFDPKFEV